AFEQKAGAELSLGLIRIKEAELVAAADAAGVEGPWIFAPNAVADGVVLYYQEGTRVHADAAERAEARLQEVSRFYALDRGSGLMATLRLESLGAEHPLWQSRGHAQAKPRAFVNAPI